MAFGDNSNARAAKAKLLQEQQESMTTIASKSGTLYRVYKDLPPGVGWVLKKVGVICPKWYLATKDEAIAAADRHEEMYPDGGHKAKESVTA